MAGALLVSIGALLWAHRYEFHRVGTIAMSPTAKAWNETVLDTEADGGKGIRRGDVVVVRSGDWAGDTAGLTYTVRVVAVAGDTVSCCDAQGRLGVNGRTVDEPYAHGDTAAFGDFTVQVPTGRIFVLGDARSISVDSRSHLKEAGGGTLPVSSVQGQLVAIAWPFQDWGSLSGPAGASRFPVYLAGFAGIVVGGLLGLVAAWPTVRGWAAWTTARLPWRHRAKAW
ncbi:signal peptidase I [Kitasatospora sp. NPDC051853]|uniref:signal peptidase I n=1 Tax=Kitasatospora sp. NPDC051853 TaxID=3364058 RepID=UPI0037B38290